MGRKYSEDDKLKALALINMDEPLREISDKLDVSYPTLLKWRTELEEAKKTNEVQELVHVTPAIVHSIAEDTKDRLNQCGAENVDEVVEGVVEGIDGYQQLSTKLQDVATNLANRIDALSRTTTGPLELQVLVESLSRLQVSFFNKNVTNVNVLNDHSGKTSGRFSGFKKRD